MSRFIILQETGSDQVMVVDKETKTVDMVDASFLDYLEDSVTGLALRAAHEGGAAVTRGIAAAIVGTQRLELSGRYFFAASAA
jgi:hypothetical protein